MTHHFLYGEHSLPTVPYVETMSTRQLQETQQKVNEILSKEHYSSKNPLYILKKAVSLRLQELLGKK